MKITLDTLTIQNFKGIKDLTYNFNGSNTITGENGAGKTTIYDAFLWLLFGKDSQGRKDFDLRPLDKDNQPIKGLTVTVAAKITFDGVQHTFVKEHTENIVKKQLRGYTTECTIDEVPKKAGEYADYIKELIDEDTFKLLTDVYFFSGKMHWSERRKVLLDMAGEIGEPEGFESLKAELNGRTVDEFKKVLADRKDRLKKEQAEINPRIDELQKGMETYADADNTEKAAIEGRRAEVQTSIEQLDQSLKAVRNQERERQVKIDRVNCLKSKRITREAELQNDQTGIKHLLDEKGQIEASVAERSRAVTQAKSAVSDFELTITSANRKLASLQEQLNQVRQDYPNLKIDYENYLKEIEEYRNTDISGSTCSACGQVLPQTKLAELEAGKAERIQIMKGRAETQKRELTNLANRGNTLKKSIDAQVVHNNGLLDEKKQLQEKLEQAQILLKAAEEHKIQRFAQIDELLKSRPKVRPEDDATWKQICFDIETLEKQIGQPVTEQIESIESQRSAKQEELRGLDNSLAQFDRIKRDTERIQELEQREKELAQAIADVESLLSDIDKYKAEQSTMIETAVNGLFKHVTFKLFKELLNGGFEDTCEAMLDGRPYSAMSYGEKIFVGVDIINALSKHYDTQVPLYVDNAESLTLPIETDMQLIRLEAVPNQPKLKLLSKKTLFA